MSLFSVIGRNRSLVMELTRREILGRYRGASFGMLWSLFSPFLMLLVYTLAFGFVLKGRWPGAGTSTWDFAIIVFVGLIVHGMFAECLTRSPQLIVGNANLVKRVVFPLDLLVWSMAFTALFHLGMNTLVLLGLRLFAEGQVAPTALLFPIVVLPLLVLTVGVAWIVSALGVFFRDLGQVVGVVATAMLFLSSAIVPVASVPEQYRLAFQLNPLTFIIDQSREVLLWNRMPDWTGLAIYMAIALVVAFVGHALFAKMRRGFADVL
jgi:lipopolysaccharide transport system permease protein